MTSESFSLSLLSLFPLALLHLIDLKLCGVVPHHFPGQIKDSTSRGMFVLLCWAFKSYCQFYQFYSKILICGQAIFHLFQQHHLVLFFRWEKNQEKYKWSQKKLFLSNGDCKQWWGLSRGRQQSWCFSGHNFSLSFGKRFLSQIWRLLSIVIGKTLAPPTRSEKKSFVTFWWVLRVEKENSISSKLSLDGKSSGRENFRRMIRLWSPAHKATNGFCYFVIYGQVIKTIIFNELQLLSVYFFSLFPFLPKKVKWDYPGTWEHQG